MTVRLLLKALRHLWPYMRSAIFKDRTVSEVVLENVHITIMLGLILCLVAVLGVTTLQLSALKEARAIARETATLSVPCECTNPINVNRLKELIRENDTDGY